MPINKVPQDSVETAYTPGLSSTVSVSARAAKYQLRGNGTRMRVEGYISWNGAGTDPGALLLALPSGWQFDANRMGGTVDGLAATSAIIGCSTWYDSGVSYKQGSVETADATRVQFITTAVLTGDLFASGDGLKFSFEAPVKRV